MTDTPAPPAATRTHGSVHVWSAESSAHLLRRLAAIETAHCVEWPRARVRGGYGRVRLDGRVVLAHRLVLTWRVGPPPTADHAAAHRCGNRACVNPRHLRWATRVENEADKIAHGRTTRGERNGSAKLTLSKRDEVIERYVAGDVLQRELGSEHGISQQTVSKIVRRERWSWAG